MKKKYKERQLREKQENKSKRKRKNYLNSARVFFDLTDMRQSRSQSTGVTG